MVLNIKVKMLGSFELHIKVNMKIKSQDDVPSKDL